MEIEQQKNIPKIQVLIRKRPLTKKEQKKKYQDIINVSNNQIFINEERNKLDMSKYIEQHVFTFDKSYDQNHSNEDIYMQAVQPLIDFALNGGKVSCFAYGQTGSGKTYTMIGNQKNPGIYALASNDIFYNLRQYQQIPIVKLSYFEIYCGKLFDLLNQRNEVIPREDNKQNIQIVGLQKIEVYSTDQIFELISKGNQLRVTSQTGKNEESSRSHAILQIKIIFDKKQKGTLSFIDLAGNERGNDTFGHDQQTRIDGAEISKSLLALKECIRALDQDQKHIPFRGSKLTMVLKDSFVGNCKTIMIGNISPAHVNCEYTLNTLRYADRVKELKNDKQKRRPAEALFLPRQRSSKHNLFKNIKEKSKIEKEEKNQNSSFAYIQKEIKLPVIQLSGKKESRKTEFPKKIQPLYKQKLSEINSLQYSEKKYHLEQKNQEQDMEFNLKLLENEHDKLIQKIVEDEEYIINDHKNLIQKNEQTKFIEEEMLEKVDKPGSSIEEYINQLNIIIEHKGKYLRDIQQKVSNFKELLQREKMLYKKLQNKKKQNKRESLLFDLDQTVEKENMFFQIN